VANLGGTFDATQVQPNQPFEVIPPGKYVVQIVASEMKPTRDGNGQYLWFEMDIIDGEFASRKLWDRLNLVNHNQQAVEIAQRTLSAICHATGQLHVEDSEALHFKPMIATVKVRPSRTENGKTFDASNEIRGYEPTTGSVAQAQQASLPMQAAAKPNTVKPAGAAPAVPPWRKPKAA
jgi:hypothetical protein